LVAFAESMRLKILWLRLDFVHHEELAWLTLFHAIA
jgi:hypothetical protein